MEKLQRNQKIVASIEARMTSSRLPGKVLMEATEGISMLEFMIERVRKAQLIDDLIVATTVNEADDPIVDICNRKGIKYFRGSEPDVLERVLGAHKSVSSDIIVELTGDCQLIDPKLIDQAIKLYLDNEFDYVSNCHVRSFPVGLDVQVFSRDLLEEVSERTSDKEDREHVSLFIYKSGLYKLQEIIADGDLFWPDLRITLDDKGDYELLKVIIEYFYPRMGYDFSAEQVIHFLKENQDLLLLTKDVRVKENLFESVAKRND